jgi:hypothetical protein
MALEQKDLGYDPKKFMEACERAIESIREEDDPVDWIDSLAKHIEIEFLLEE